MKRNQFQQQEWGLCLTCGRPRPVSQLRLHPRWSWQCTGPQGNGCWDGIVDRDFQSKIRPIHVNEGVRKSPAPLTNTLNEGLDGDEIITPPEV